jgi:hypothetical protein
MSTTVKREGNYMRAEDVKRDAASRIMMELCKHCVYTRESGVAVAVRDALAKKLSQTELNQLFNMVVIGRKEG